MKAPSFRILLPFLFWTSYTLAGEDLSFLQIREVVEEWSPDQHLRIKGQIGVSPERLDELESWLDANAPNWTVVLMQTAGNQTYDGRSGMTAVEFALGEGLSNETGFGQLADKRTGEANGAVFVLFLEERKFSYFASDAYDKRGLGEQYWVGRLDEPAIQAMRNGGRIVDAARNTISSIESLLTRQLNDEAEQKRLAELEQQKAVAEAGKFAGRLGARVHETEARLAAFSKANPKVTGPLASPDLPTWQASISAITSLVSTGDLTNARKEFLSTDNAISAFHLSLDQWESDLPRFDVLEESIRQHPSPVQAKLVAGSLARAQEAARSSRENHAIGDPLYSSQLEEADRALIDATGQLAEWNRGEARIRTIKRTVLILAFFAFLTFLIVTNRLRYPAKKEAEALYLSWKEQLRGKFDELFELMDRAGMVVGSSMDIDSRGYAGTTAKLAREAIKSVDELFIMSAATDRVMLEAEALISPRSPFAQLINGFSSQRYHRAIRLLSGEPIGFNDKDRLAAILRIPEANETKKHTRSLLGRLEDYEPFMLSFGQLIEAYDARQTLAKGHITRLSAGIDGLPLAQQDLSASLEKLSDHTDELALLATNDRLFSLDSLRTILLPAAEKSLTLTADLGKTDPVAGFETLLPESSRLVAETRTLVERVAQFRDHDLPRIAGSVKQLRELGRSTSWIDEALAALETRSGEIAVAAASASAAESLAEWDDDLTRLTGRALSSVDLTLRARDGISARLASGNENLTRARLDLSTGLGLDGNSLLMEPGLSPVEKLELGRQSMEVALSAIDRGETATALRNLDESDRCLEDSEALIQLSRDSAANHAGKLKALQQEHRALESGISPAAEKLREMQGNYAPSVLLFSAPYGDNVNGPQTVLECVDRATRRLAVAAGEFNESATAFTTGELIRAQGLLETITSELDFARHQLALIDDHYAALKTAESAISPSLEEKRSRYRDLGVLASDRRTCQSTLTELETVTAKIESLLKEHAAGGGDPFVRLRQTESAGQTLQAINDGIRADWKAYEMADTATTGTRAALTFCHSFLREAQSDGIPDSRVLTRAMQRHSELTVELDGIVVSLGTAHQEWPDWFNRVNALTGEVAKVRSTLEEELTAARDAVSEINAASESVADLHRWRSGHSVSIDRNAGINGLAKAKQQLASGLYAEARQNAIAARGSAIGELQRAKAAESAKILAAAAAVSLAASQSRRLSSSSFGSSSSSGFSSSGFSSGSGFSRSGW